MARGRPDCTLIAVAIHAIAICVICPPAAAQSAGPFRLIRSLAGPSGKVVGSKYVLDEVRNRFTYPQDKEFVVSFEWEGPPGEHVLTGLWKGPDGRTVSMSSDIRLNTAAREFSAYWTYEIATGVPSGVWSLEVRIDGVPAGSHSFELIIPEEARALTDTDPVPGATVPTPDDVYRATRSSVVWVHRLDETGRRTDTGSGFVLASNQIATAFQLVDSAAMIEIEFEGGRKVTSDELWSWNRLQDWAVIKAETAGAVPLGLGSSVTLPVAERLLGYNVEADGARVFGGIDLAGRNTLADFGERLHLNPALSAAAVGGPLLNISGEVVGIVGGSTFPGGRIGRRDLGISVALYASMMANNRATPIELVHAASKDATSFAALRDAGVLSALLVPMPSFTYGATSLAFKGAKDAMPQSMSEFSRKDAEIWIYSVWQHRDKTSKGMVSAMVYDADNRVRVKVQPKKLSIPTNAPIRYGFSFSPQALQAGGYRADVLFDGRPVWRTFFTITD